jgi:creatinine amidohydrolase
MNYIYDVCHSFVRQGHTRIVLVNGHGSNAMPCALVARRIVNETDDALAAAVNHWNLARDLAARIRESPIGGMAHACEYETSWYLFLEPGLVQMELAVADIMARRTQYTWVDILAGEGPVAFTDDWSRVSNGSGVEGDPLTATAEKGRRYAEEEVAHLIHFCEQFKAMEVLPRRNYTARGKDENPYKF